MKMKKDKIILAIVLGIAVSCSMPKALAIANPVVSFTNPIDGQTVSGIVNVTASASSSAGVIRTEIKIDSQSVKINTSTNPLPMMKIAYTWNTSTYSDGAHNITAIGTVIGGSNNSVTITVTVQNTKPTSTAPNTAVTVVIIIGAVGAGVVGLALLNRHLALKGKKGRKPRNPENKPREFNPQPEPPGKGQLKGTKGGKPTNPENKPREFNPQPEPPGKGQPGKSHHMVKKKKIIKT